MTQSSSRSRLFLSVATLCLASTLTGCELFVHFDRSRISADAGADGNAMDTGVDGSADAGRDVGTLDDTGVDDTGVDAFVDPDADVDAFVEPIDAGSDAFVEPVDAGSDAFVVPVDAGTDAFVVPVDAGTDAFVDPCMNGVMDGTETDEDCGGSCTANCATGEMCAVDGDCATTCNTTTMLCD